MLLGSCSEWENLFDHWQSTVPKWKLKLKCLKSGNNWKASHSVQFFSGVLACLSLFTIFTTTRDRTNGAPDPQSWTSWSIMLRTISSSFARVIHHYYGNEFTSQKLNKNGFPTNAVISIHRLDVRIPQSQGTETKTGEKEKLLPNILLAAIFCQM